MQNDKETNLFDVTWKSSVSVPTLLYHDTNEHVLVMSDLGPLPSMLDLFSDTCGGFNIRSNLAIQLRQVGSVVLNSISSEETELRNFFIQLGTQIGHFFALIHSRNTLNILRSRF